MQSVGVVAGRHDQCGCGVGSDAEDVEEVGHGGDEERLDTRRRARQVRRRAASIRWANEDSDALVAAVTGSGDRVGPEPGPFGDKGRHREAFEAATELFGSCVAEVAHLDEGLGSGLAGRALGDDEHSDGFDSTVPGLRACHSLGR